MISLLFKNVLISLEELLFVDVTFLKKFDIEFNKVPISYFVFKQVNQFILTVTKRFIFVLNNLLARLVSRLILSHKRFGLSQVFSIHIFCLLLDLEATILKTLNIVVEEFLFVDLLGEFLEFILFEDLLGGEDADWTSLDLIF
jgi:hypothetical protein